MTIRHLQRFSAASGLFLSGLAAFLVGRELLSSEKTVARVTTEPSRLMTIRKPVSQAAAGVGGRNSSASQALSMNTAFLEAPRKHRAAIQSSAARQAASARTTEFAHDAGNQTAAHSAQRQVAGMPFSFSIPREQLVAGSPEEEALYNAQIRFADELNSLTEADPASPEYASQWNRSAASHDEQLRLRLGGPAYVQLTAMATQAEQTARESAR